MDDLFKFIDQQKENKKENNRRLRPNLANPACSDEL